MTPDEFAERTIGRLVGRTCLKILKFVDLFRIDPIVKEDVDKPWRVATLTTFEDGAEWETLYAAHTLDQAERIVAAIHTRMPHDLNIVVIGPYRAEDWEETS